MVFFRKSSDSPISSPSSGGRGKDSGNIIRFATTNADKIREAGDILPRPVIPVEAELVEMQTTDMETLVRHKAAQAYQKINMPLMVEDTGLVFFAWKELPGPFIRYFLDNLGLDGLVDALAPFDSWAAEAVCGVGYHDGEEIHYFEGRTQGMIVPPVGKGGFGWDPIFKPAHSSKTLAEMTWDEKKAVSMRTIAFKKMTEFLNPLDLD
ncbi:MAG: non-canonical purine NTP pyrophosphatase [Deltaproteobacteria bacterium]|nr:non-canonical purine NTP pyrophosphatase [Deltaproteobacteria bacterium]